MADHIDKQIRDAANTKLTNLTTTETRVFKSRVYPLQEGDLPALRIYVDSSDLLDDGIGGANRAIERHVRLVVEFCDKATASYDDASDASKKEIEVALGNDNTLTGLVNAINLRRIETERDGDGDQVVIVTRLLFDCTVFTELNAPDVPV